MAWDIADSKPLERPVSLPAKQQHIGHTTVEWFEAQPGVAVIVCEGGTVDDRWLAQVVVREQLAACGIRQARFSFDQEEPPEIHPDQMALWKPESEPLNIVTSPYNRQDHPEMFQFPSHDNSYPFFYAPNKNSLLIGPQSAYHKDMFRLTPGWESYDAPYLRDHGKPDFGYAGRVSPTGEVRWYDDTGDAERVENELAKHFGQPISHHDDGLDEDFEFHLGHRKTSDWNDIMAKAKRLIQSGNVTLLRNGYNIVVAHVIGDHGEYQSEISRDDPNSRVITQWTCECPWDQFAFQRTRQWKKYEARPCAHVLAAFWKSLGTPLDEQLTEDQANNMGTGQAIPGGGIQGPPPGSTFGPSPMGMGQGPTIEQGYQPQPGMMPQPGMPQPGMMPGMIPNPTTMAPSQLPPLMAPPGENQVIPPYPMNPDQLQLPVSVPGGRPGPYPANPMQQPGTFSRVIKVANGQEFPAGSSARINEATLGQSEGREGATDAGQWMEIPRNAQVEVVYQDPSTGWVEVLYPLKGGPMTSYHVRCFVEPEKLTPFPNALSPFQNPKGKR